jgi:stress-induced morphogen
MACFCLSLPANLFNMMAARHWKSPAAGAIYSLSTGNLYTMAMSATDIEKFIKDGLPDAQVEIKDLAGDGNHYAATVISAAFKGKSRVQQHQMVYAALKGNMGGVLHALALTTSAPQD